MLIFDCNAALGRRHDRIVEYDRREDLLRVMAEAGISRALVYNPYGIHASPTEGNGFLVEEIRGAERLIPQFVVSLAIDDIEQVQREARDANVRSFRVFPRTHAYPLVHWIADPWLEWMAENGMSLWIPMGRDAEVDLRDLYETARRHPRVPIVLAGVYYTNYPAVWPLLKALDHVYVDLSRFDLINGVERLVQHVGAERLLFGSDFPEIDPKPTIYYLQRCKLNQDELAAICHANLMRLLGMHD